MRVRTGVLYMRNYGLFSVVNRMNELVTTGNQFSQNAVAPRRVVRSYETLPPLLF